MLIRNSHTSWRRLLVRLVSSSLIVACILLCVPSHASWWRRSCIHFVPHYWYTASSSASLILRGGAEEGTTANVTTNDTSVRGDDDDDSSVRVSTLPPSMKNETTGVTAAGTVNHQQSERLLFQDGVFNLKETHDRLESSNGQKQVPTAFETDIDSASLVDSTTSSSDNDQEEGEEEDKLSLLDRKRLQFLDRIALISSSWMKKEQDAHLESHQDETDDLEAITAESDLRQPGRHFHIVTTAALPWFTGTAVNPLLRAAYLHRRTVQINQNCNATTTSNSTTPTAAHRYVTLVIPWLELAQDQQELYGRVFGNLSDQETYIRDWLRNEAEMPDVACPDRGLQILFYPARYHAGLRSIFAMGDLLSAVADETKDVCILEEPEHVNWFRAPGDGWTKKYRYVVGVVHTNYKEYASSHYSGLWTAPAISMVSSAMVRAYCHKVIKLSSVLQTYAPEKEVVSNVHGVRAEFLKEGEKRASMSTKVGVGEASVIPASIGTSKTQPSTQVYFVGKLLWAKGLDIMLDLQDYYKQCTGQYFPIDIYGSGPEQDAIKKAFHGRRKTVSASANGDAEAAKETTGTRRTSKKKRARRRMPRNPLRRVVRTTLSIFGGTREPVAVDESQSPDLFPSLEVLQDSAKERLARLKQSLDAVELPKTFAELLRREPIPATFPGRVDHAEIKQHKVFVNPSTSEVLCTTTAEALAMGKFAIIPVHPSNQFFLKFPNCLAYRSKFEFVANLRWAMTHEPEPMSPELLRHFTWEAATDRFIEASIITVREALERERLGRSKLDERIAWLHNELGKGTSGDILRKICGAGPVSHQVKYLKDKEDVEFETTTDERYDDGTEDEDDGLSRKFRSSSFAEAIRATIGDLSSFIQ